MGLINCPVCGVREAYVVCYSEACPWLPGNSMNPTERPMAKTKEAGTEVALYAPIDVSIDVSIEETTIVHEHEHVHEHYHTNNKIAIAALIFSLVAVAISFANSPTGAALFK